MRVNQLGVAKKNSHFYVLFMNIIHIFKCDVLKTIFHTFKCDDFNFKIIVYTCKCKIKIIHTF